MDVTELDDIIFRHPSSGTCSNREYPTTIDKISCNVEYSDIFKNYLLSNVPFILSIPQTDWKCYNEWTENGKPKLDYLDCKYGFLEVPVANCGIKYFNSQEKGSMRLKEFLVYWKTYINNNYPKDMKCLYLKDWHFTRDLPEESIYIVPKYFSSDWLNEYLTSKNDGSTLNDDYRFVYMGPKGTWTPFHADVFTSFSWSANICGKKRWLLFPPGEEKHMKDKFGNLVYDVESKSLSDLNLYPDYNNNIKSYEVIQESGEAVFVPSGWHHQVWNLEDTISVNHNWINGCNINTMWQSLKQNLELVKKEILDCQTMDGWVNHCQVMLKASFGMDFREFYEFIQFIAIRRIYLIEAKDQLTVYGGWKLGMVHATFDLVKIREVLCNFISNVDLKSLDFYNKKISEVQRLIKQIDELVSIET